MDLREKLEALIETEYRGHSDMSLADAVKVTKVALESLPCRCLATAFGEEGIQCRRCALMEEIK